MRVQVLCLLLLPLSVGCAGLGGFEVRTTNMGPYVAGAVHGAANNLKQHCTAGVAYEERNARVEARTPYQDYRPLNPRQEVLVDTKQVVVCR